MMDIIVTKYFSQQAISGYAARCSWNWLLVYRNL